MNKNTIELPEGEQVCNNCGDPFIVITGEFARDIDPEDPRCGVCAVEEPRDA